MVHTSNAIITVTLALSAAAPVLAAPVVPHIRSSFSSVNARAPVPPLPIQPPATEPKAVSAPEPAASGTSSSGVGGSDTPATALHLINRLINPTSRAEIYVAARATTGNSAIPLESLQPRPPQTVPDNDVITSVTPAEGSSAAAEQPATAAEQPVTAAEQPATGLLSKVSATWSQLDTAKKAVFIASPVIVGGFATFGGFALSHLNRTRTRELHADALHLLGRDLEDLFARLSGIDELD